MLQPILEPAWGHAFETVLGRCELKAGDTVAVLSESQSRPELPAILRGGARVVYVSNEHPEALARLLPDPALEPLVKEHVKRLRSARSMHVTSAAGTDLVIGMAGASCGGNWGYTTRPGT